MSKRVYAKGASPKGVTKTGKGAAGTSQSSPPGAANAGKGDHEASTKEPKEHIAGFQEDEDLMHESLHQLVKDDKPKPAAVPEAEKKPEVFYFALILLRRPLRQRWKVFTKMSMKMRW